MNKKLRRMDEHGVSEVVGSILTLGVTVIIFTGIFWGIQSLEPPERQSYIRFETSVYLETGGSVYINITNIGGSTMREQSTRIYLFVNNDDNYRIRFSNDTYGDDLEDGRWGIGDTLNLYYPDDHPIAEAFNEPMSVVHAMIIDDDINQQVYNEEIKSADLLPPFIRDMGVIYPLDYKNHALPGELVTLYVDVVDKDTYKLDDINVTLDLSGLEGSEEIVDMERQGNRPRDINRYTFDLRIRQEQEDGNYLLPLRASDPFRAEYNYSISLNIGSSPAWDETPHLVIHDIRWEAYSPTNRDRIYVTATINNAGGGSTRADITFTDFGPDGNVSHSVSTERMFPAGGGMDVEESWTIRRAGAHNITVSVRYNDEIVNESVMVFVRPNILLVDNDDTGTDIPFMKQALESNSFEYDLFSVRPGFDRPKYDEGDIRMSNYDIVIWMTGTRNFNTITFQDRHELRTFIENDHRLWLIGEGICRDAEDNGWDGWLEDYLKAGIQEAEADAPQNDLIGISDPVVGEEFALRDVGRGSYIHGVNGGMNSIIEVDEHGDLIDDTVVVVAYNSTESDARSFFQSTLFSSMEEEKSSSRTRLTYNVILWLGNIDGIGGNDLALSSQTYSTRSPNYMDVVEVSAIIRNNGLEALEPDVVLKVNGFITQRIEPRPVIPGGGDQIEVTFDWTARPVGQHDVRVVIDPYNVIPETNIQNNDPTYLGINTTVDVRYSTLIVAADGGETSDELYSIYVDDLGYACDVFTVEEGNDGPDSDEMALYNTIFWVTGSRENPLTDRDMSQIRDLLHNHSDQKNFALIGDGILDGLSNGSPAAEGFMRDVLKVEENSIYPVIPKPEKLLGTYDDPLTHGARYTTHWTSDNANSYSVTEDAIPILEDPQGRTFAHRYVDGRYRLVFTSFDLGQLSSPVPLEEEHWYQRYGFNTSARSMRGELVYLVNLWFGNTDNRVELRISEPDVIISDARPMLGRTYQITVRIQNVGGTGTNALVRFRDGTSHIGSSSAYVPPYGFSDVEIKWQPLHAGANRPIRVVVDAIHEVPELPNQRGQRTAEDIYGFNNQAIVYTPVYYFWDDMQDDARVRDNWVHEAQIAYISGETPIDFMGGLFDSVDTNVAGDWDADMSSGVVKTDDEAKSAPYSYFMEEPVGSIMVKSDVLISIVIDNSFSMGDRTIFDEDAGGHISWLEKAKKAAVHLVNELSNGSMVGIWAYQGTNPQSVISPPILLEGNRDSVIGEINGISDNPQAPVWDTFGNAYTDVIDLMDDHPDLIPAVIGFTDGADKQAADTAEQPGFMKGSNDWAPWHKMENNDGTPIEFYGSHMGKFRFDYRQEQDPDPHEPGEWSDLDLHPPVQFGNRKGLLNSPIPFFTIGLGLEHNFDLDENPDNPDWNVAPNLGLAGPNNFLIEKDPDNSATWEAGTVEYNLWRIATTSDAQYFYAPDPEDLEDIFDKIIYLLTGPQNLTSIDPDPERLLDDGLASAGGNTNKYAITPMLDLTNTESAWLSFWHKYRLIQGVNGAYLEIGVQDPDDPGNYLWQYVKPSIGPYTGNLLLQEDLPIDSFGNDMMWCWNGKSAGGTMQWEYVRLNMLRELNKIVEEGHLTQAQLDGVLDTVRVRFYYKQYGGGLSPGGWWIDDVSVVVTREGNLPDNIEEGMHDTWFLEETEDKYGDETRAWRNACPITGYFRKGIDNRLVTAPIDLTNADTATLSADFKFNVNTADGRPPDGFRVEVSTDSGRSWSSINLGVRAASGVSGTGGDAGENMGNNWTTAGSLDRLNVDLSDYAGNVILIRFRVVTCGHSGYRHYEEALEWGGFYVNNVIVYGDTIRH